MQCNNNLPSHKYVHRFHDQTVNGFTATGCCCSVGLFMAVLLKLAVLLEGLDCNDAVLGNGPPDVTSESSWLEPLLSAEPPAGR